MKCTWKDCQAEGTKPWHDRNGTEWAVLCESHAAEADGALETLDAKLMMSAWVKAGHDHPRREQSLAAGVNATTRLAAFLAKIGKLID